MKHIFKYNYFKVFKDLSIVYNYLFIYLFYNLSEIIIKYLPDIVWNYYNNHCRYNL